MCPERARVEVEELVGRGAKVQLVETDQCYALVEAIKAPSPPWNKTAFDILIAIPAAYDAAELDSFYLELPYTFNGGEHSRIKGAVIDVLKRQWRLVSWHYEDDKKWLRGRDSLESHIAHCHGFFLNRGATNAP